MSICDPAKMELAERALFMVQRRPRQVRLLDMETIELILSFSEYRYAQLQEADNRNNTLPNVRGPGTGCSSSVNLEAGCAIQVLTQTMDNSGRVPILRVFRGRHTCAGRSGFIYG